MEKRSEGECERGGERVVSGEGGMGRGGVSALSGKIREWVGEGEER